MKRMRVFTILMASMFLSFAVTAQEECRLVVGTWQVTGEKCDSRGENCHPEDSPILTFGSDGTLQRNLEKRGSYEIRGKDIVIGGTVLAVIISIEKETMVIRSSEPGSIGFTRLTRVKGDPQAIMEKWRK